MSDFIQDITQTYMKFFEWDKWIQVLTDPVSWGLIGTLVILEGLLSADNALVLAVMVRHLPVAQRKKALFCGLIGAYLLRFIAIGIGVYLIQLWWIKALGALYLAWLSIRYFIDKKKGEKVDEEVQGVKKNGLLIRMFGPFWGTVVSVEMMDAAFSVDSILAALGISEKVWVLLIGGMLGVLMMRGVAGLFLRLIDRVPELETTAYVIIIFISIKMLLSILHIEIEHIYFFAFIVLAFILTFITHSLRRKTA
jgi:YkoY family integral membrane protein